MKPFTYIVIGALLGIAIITSLAFSRVNNNHDEGTITLHKRIESTDPSCLQMYYYIEQYADSFEIPRNYAFGIAHAETGYDGPFDWSYNHRQTSRAGAVGPMQIMLTTARYVNDERVTLVRLKNSVEYNVRTSMKLLRELYDRYGDWKLVFGCYNTGKPIINKYALKVYSYVPPWTVTSESDDVSEADQ